LIRSFVDQNLLDEFLSRQLQQYAIKTRAGDAEGGFDFLDKEHKHCNLLLVGYS